MVLRSAGFSDLLNWGHSGRSTGKNVQIIQTNLKDKLYYFI